METRTARISDAVNCMQHDTQREVAAVLAALLRSLGFERVRVVFEQPPAT